MNVLGSPMTSEAAHSQFPWTGHGQRPQKTTPTARPRSSKQRKMTTFEDLVVAVVELCEASPMTCLNWVGNVAELLEDKTCVLHDNIIHVSLCFLYFKYITNSQILMFL